MRVAMATISHTYIAQVLILHFVYRLWSMSSSSPEPVFILPHPCYVYSVCFSSEGFVFTGAYDGNIRLWVLPQAPPTSPQVGTQCNLHQNSHIVFFDDTTLFDGTIFRIVSA